MTINEDLCVLKAVLWRDSSYGEMSQYVIQLRLKTSHTIRHRLETYEYVFAKIFNPSIGLQALH